MTRTGPPDVLTRREALKRTALLVGGTLALSFVDAAEHVVWAATPGWAPRVLSAAQLEMVAVMAEHIIPATDTPGARAAGVHRLVDVLLADHYGAAERDRFLAGLRAANVRAIREYGAPFLRCSAAQQLAFVTTLDDEAYAPPPPPEAAVTGAPRRDLFFRRLKELTLFGYYTSRLGATTELGVVPFGPYQGDIPYRRIGHAWA